MGRRLRYIPVGGALVEVTARTLQGRFLLRPTSWVNEAIVGVLARGRQREPSVKVHALAFLSNHYHLLLWVPHAKALRTFMEFVNSNLAREIGRLVKWREKFWSRRYQHIVVSAEPNAQIERLRYILSHGVKEDLVKRAEDWPGVHGLGCLLRGEKLQGYWFDRTAEYKARLRGEDFERLTYATPEALQLDPLPCWRHLSVEQRQQRVRELVEEIEVEHAARRRAERKWVLGVHAIKARDPHEHPREPKKSLAPWFHAGSRKVRRELRQAYEVFYEAFREATDELRTGNREAPFPEGSHPPALPFVVPSLLARPQPA